ncbi:MAG TPA: HAD family hydrolase [Verrucomicrobiae bacterium]|nr:HAD family hydrolase [Verrucomicrobiae bacterium]
MKAVFLDRDGVLNRAVIRDGKPYPPADVGELEIVPDAAEALAALKDSGFLLFVVTNQPDIARGKQTWLMLDAIHAEMAAGLPIDGFYVCPHDDPDGCGCRKPKPGLLQQAASEHAISLADSYMIGDRWRDVEAGRRAGCRTIWLDFGYRERGPDISPDATLDSLTEAAAWILAQPRKL